MGLSTDIKTLLGKGETKASELIQVAESDLAKFNNILISKEDQPQTVNHVQTVVDVVVEAEVAVLLSGYPGLVGLVPEISAILLVFGNNVVASMFETLNSKTASRPVVVPKPSS